jgi:drug/metabolite transporter (DMT)-like permease
MNPGRGIALKIASTLFFTLMLVCVKAMAERIPFGEIVFARSFFALIPIIGMLLWQRQLVPALRTSRPWLHASRGFVGLLSMTLGFMALAYLPLPEAMTIGYAAPLMIVALAALVLGEHVRIYRWSAVAIGFLGVVVILWPRFTLFAEGAATGATLIGAMLALAAAFFSAFAAIFIRSLTQTEATGTIVFYFAFNSTLLALASLPFGWILPTAWDGFLLVATGLLGGIGQILMTSAYRNADAATVASFDYTSMLWGLAFGYIFFAEIPSDSVVLGGAIVVGAGIFIIFRERSLGLQPAQTAAQGDAAAAGVRWVLPRKRRKRLLLFAGGAVREREQPCVYFSSHSQRC